MCGVCWCVYVGCEGVRQWFIGMSILILLVCGYALKPIHMASKCKNDEV